MIAVAALAALSLSRAWAASLFVTDLRKAESRKEPDERVEWYTRAIQAFDASEDRMLLAQCHFGRGQARVELWQFAQAEPDLTKALDLDAANNRSYLLRGRARLELGQNAAAARDLAQYVGLQPDDEEGYLYLSRAQLKLSRDRQALDTCLKAEKLDDADGRAWLCEGRARMARRDWEGALGALATAQKRQPPRLPDAAAESAVCQVALGRHERALAEYDKALPDFETELADLCARGAPPPQLQARQQDAARAYFGRGRVREFLTQRAGALADYDRACALGHAPACARAEALRPESAKARPAPPAAAPAVEPPPSKPAKRKRSRAPSSDPGERIYGS